MPLTYHLPACMGVNAAIPALSSLLGVLFAASVSTLLLKLYNDDWTVATVVAVALLIGIMLVLAAGLSSLYSEQPSLSLARNVAVAAIFGLITVVLMEYHSHVPNTAVRVLVYLFTVGCFLLICFFNVISRQFKRALCLRMKSAFCGVDAAVDGSQQATTGSSVTEPLLGEEKGNDDSDGGHGSDGGEV